MDISRLDAWYSSKEGSLETPATYIVRGLCRRCCLPELVLRSMQVKPLVAMHTYVSVSAANSSLPIIKVSTKIFAEKENSLVVYISEN